MDTKNKNTAFVCPGQGSQYVGMGKDIAQHFSVAKKIFDQANDILDFDISSLAWEGPEEELNDTVNTQPALMTHSVASWRIFQEKHPEIKTKYVAGHSMGELTALVLSGAMGFPEALRLVRRRGEEMKRAGKISPGKMAAILGLDISTVEQITSDASKENETVQVANDNCPGQVVISGDSIAIERAVELAKNAGAKRAVPLAISIAAHSQLMRHAQDSFNQAVQNAPISNPEIPIIGNVTGRPLTTVADIQLDLQSQLTHRVRWTESVEFMIAQGVDTFIELGSGNVLSGLIRRIDKGVERLSFDKAEDFNN